MVPLILFILGVSGVYGDSHSMRYYQTVVSAPGSGLPVYSSVGYVDDREISNYNSDTRRYLPKTEWMKKLEPEYWETQTQIAHDNEPAMKRNVQVAMQRFNQTGGIHIVQWMKGCEVRDDGSTAGYNQYGYDGKDLMYLDTQRGLWIPAMHEAQITTQRWNSPEVRAGERNKNYLENICTEWLKKHISNGREDLERREPDNGLSPAVIAAVAICCLLVVAAVTGGVIVYKRRTPVNREIYVKPTRWGLAEDGL